MDRAEYTRALRFHAEKPLFNSSTCLRLVFDLSSTCLESDAKGLQLHGEVHEARGPGGNLKFSRCSVRWRAPKGSTKPSAATKQAGRSILHGVAGVFDVLSWPGVFTVSFRNKELCDICKEGASIRMQNTSVRMVKGFIRVVVDKWAAFKPADEALAWEAKSSNDMSTVEYELVES